MTPPRARRQRNSLIAGGAALAAFVALCVWMIHYVMAHRDDKPARMVQNVQLIRPPPPPPDELPPPPPPDKVDTPIEQEEPEPSPSEESPSQQLGLDSEGSSGSDAFGLAARKGGHDMLGSGGAIFAWYTGKVKDQAVEKLSADTRLKAKKYNVLVQFWIETDGRVSRVKLASGTGNHDLDLVIESCVASIGSLGESPPIEMPQPVTIRFVQRI
jgi:periplasmic protein TonB